VEFSTSVYVALTATSQRLERKFIRLTILLYCTAISWQMRATIDFKMISNFNRGVRRAHMRYIIFVRVSQK